LSQLIVSIIIPSYNQALFLEQCLNSVLDQDYPDIECIVIDGGSTDGSVDIIRRYEERLAYWVSEPDKGQSHAINKGFLQATGEIVAWLNSDDLYFPGAVSSAVKCFQNNSKLVLFYGHCLFID
jgi:glycosyltransferase involved in cell wall biosynthesis